MRTLFLYSCKNSIFILAWFLLLYDLSTFSKDEIVAWPVLVIHEQDHKHQFHALCHVDSWDLPHRVDPWKSSSEGQTPKNYFLVRMSILVSVVPGLNTALANSIDPCGICLPKSEQRIWILFCSHHEDPGVGFFLPRRGTSIVHSSCHIGCSIKVLDSMLEFKVPG